MPTIPSQVASNRRHFATIGVTVPTKPARSICILGDDNIGRMSDVQHNSSARLRVDNVVQHNADSGSPRAHADELAVAYHERWEQETGHDQLKTHLRGPGKILRSGLPDLVHQEIWAYLIVHHAICALIAKASAAADLDPDRISFAKTLRLIRRSATGTADIPPCGLG